MAKTAETTVGTTTLLDEGMSEEQILAAGGDTRDQKRVREAQYISAAQAWKSFKTNYFEGMEELVEGSADDNPLSGFASYGIFLNSTEEQDKIVECLKGMGGARKVRYSSTAMAGLISAGKVAEATLIVIICVLLAVTVLLISSTIFATAALRRRENEIMCLTGATNYMICAPFVVEDALPGALGAAVPLAGMYAFYQRTVICISEHYQMLIGMFGPIPLGDMLPYMAATTGCLSVGVGSFIGYSIIYRHSKVQGRRI